MDPKVSMGVGKSSFAERIKKARFAYPLNVEFVGFDSFEGRDIYIYKVLKFMDPPGTDYYYYFVIPLSYDYLDDKETLSYFYARSQNSKNVDGSNDWLGREVGERYLARKRNRIQEGLDFERGKDPKSAMDIGLSNVIYNQWDELQSERGIGGINIEKSLNGVWYLVIFVAQFPGSSEDGFKKAQKYFGEYLNPFYNKKGGEIKIKIRPEYVQAFIDAYNKRYLQWAINEGMDFERGDIRKSMGLGSIYFDKFENVIITALEGGSNYWYQLIDEDYRDKLPPKTVERQSLSERIAYALYTDPKFELPVYDVEEPDELLGKVTQYSMYRAFEIAKSDYPDAYENIMEEKYDATDADILFQLATMGELVFG